MKKFLFNNRMLRGRRRDLRKRQTSAEEVLWKAIRSRKFHKLKFYRQYSVGPYVLDFYCPELSLSIELDGDSHSTADAKVYDQERTAYLQSLGIDELRWKNEEVLNNLEKALGQIKISPNWAEAK